MLFLQWKGNGGPAPFTRWPFPFLLPFMKTYVSKSNRQVLVLLRVILKIAYTQLNFRFDMVYVLCVISIRSMQYAWWQRVLSLFHVSRIQYCLYSISLYRAQNESYFLLSCIIILLTVKTDQFQRGATVVYLLYQSRFKNF